VAIQYYQDRPRRLDIREYQCLSLDIILGSVHTVERYHAALSNVNDRKTTLARITTDHKLVITDREPDCLETKIVLVRPEPWQRRIGFWNPANRFGCRDGHVICVLYRFKADFGFVSKMIVMQRAISDRENIGKTCSAMRIHRNAVIALSACQEQWLDSWDYPHAYNHQIGSNHFVIRQTDSGYSRSHTHKLDSQSD
jgi:hypothetical protein